MLAWIKARLSDHFGFSKAEANGTLVLLLLTSLLLVASPLLRWYQATHLDTSNDEDIVLLERTLAQLEAQQQPANTPHIKRSHPIQRPEQPQLFDINTTDQAQLRQIKGIGPKLSARIVKFRNKLGGFVSPAQYEEVYGLPPAVIKRLRAQTYIAAHFQPERLNINTVGVSALAAHPYLTYQQAQRIVRHRTQQGPWARVEALRSLLDMEETTWTKLQPYLTVQ